MARWGGQCQPAAVFPPAGCPAAVLACSCRAGTKFDTRLQPAVPSACCRAERPARALRCRSMAMAVWRSSASPRVRPRKQQLLLPPLAAQALLQNAAAAATAAAADGDAAVAQPQAVAQPPAAATATAAAAAAAGLPMLCFPPDNLFVVGKSTLLTELTGTSSEAAGYGALRTPDCCCVITGCLALQGGRQRPCALGCCVCCCAAPEQGCHFHSSPLSPCAPSLSLSL